MLRLSSPQTQHTSSVQYTGSFDCARQLYRSGGVASLYRGLGATVLRGGRCPCTPCAQLLPPPQTFILTECTLVCTSPSYGHSHRERGISCDPLVTMVTTGLGPCRREELDPALIVFAGGTAGMSFWLAAIVPDTLKSILQTGTRQKHGGVHGGAHVVCYPCSYITPSPHSSRGEVQRCCRCLS